jgi:exosortase/archaeosortase family protein
VAGDLITVAGFRVRIVLECTAIHPLLIYAAFVLAHPASLRRTASGLVAGSALLFSVNILRIALVTLVGAHWPLFFELLHVYLGQVIMLLLVLATALAWQRYCNAGHNPLSFVLQALLWASILFVPWVVLNKFYYMNALDALVYRAIAVLSSQSDFTIERPVALFNHTFAIPFYLALVLAVSGSPVVRRLKYALAGTLVIVGWHLVFRFFQVAMELFKLNELQPLYLTIYLGGQFLVPLLLWVSWFGPPHRITSGNPVAGSGSARLASLLLLGMLLCPVSSWAEALLVIKQTASNSYRLELKGLQRITQVIITMDYVLQGATRAPNLIPIGLGPYGSLKIESSSSNGDAHIMKIVFVAPSPLSRDGALANLILARGDVGSARVADLRVSAQMLDFKGQSIDTRVEVEDSHAIEEQVNTVSLSKKDETIIRRRSLKGLLEQFLVIDEGKRTTEVLAGLAAFSGAGEYRQEPMLLIVDGAATVRVVFLKSVTYKETPGFVIKGAEFIEYSWLPSGELAVDVVPDKGALRASITIINKDEQVEYPLAIAPPVELFDASKAGAGEAEFVAVANRVVRGNQKP